MWTQHAQVLEETGAGQTDVDTTCSGFGRDWSRTGRCCRHSMLRHWKRLAQDRQMWTQQAQLLEETGAGQTDMDTACSGVGREWRRTDRCGHSMLWSLPNHGTLRLHNCDDGDDDISEERQTDR